MPPGSLRPQELLAPLGSLPALPPQGSEGKTQDRERAELSRGQEAHRLSALDGINSRQGRRTAGPGDVLVLSPEPATWQHYVAKGLYRCDGVKGLEMPGLARIIQVGPMSSQGSL